MSWWSILLYFLLLVIFLIFILWIDWKFKCKKTVKENKLNFYAVGYAILKGDENLKTIILIDGLLGVNQKELVFGNRFKDEVINLKEKISDVCRFDVLEYDENDFLKFVNKYFDEIDVKAKYIIRNMAGYSKSKRIPKLIRTRMICKIGFTNDTEFLYCYKNTSKNVEAIENIKKFILSE